MNIYWSPTAVGDLEAIRRYIAGDSQRSAQKIANRIKQAVERLANFPLSGRIGRVAGTRELVVPRTFYVVAYWIENDEVQIAAVTHGKQEWPSKF